MTEKIYAPFSGLTRDISCSSDPVFAEKMMGDGLILEPDSDSVIVNSPCDGQIVSIYKTLHAVTIKTAEGYELLLHLGVDTVELNGKGFKKLTEAGTTVKAGTPLIEMNVKYLRESGFDPNLLMIILDKKAVFSKKPMSTYYDSGTVVAELSRKESVDE